MQYGCALGRICFDLLTIRLYQYFACSANNIMSTIVQYVVVRGDLLKLQKWPVGALIAQACHASSAAIHLFYEAEDTKQYLSDLDRMHKVVLEAQDEGSLSELATTLTASEIDHKLWVEQPENYPTCLATRPYPKQTVQQYFKKFKLFK